MHEGSKRPTWKRVLSDTTGVLNETRTDTLEYVSPDELWMDGKPNAEVCAEVLRKRDHVKHVIQNGKYDAKETEDIFRLAEIAWLYAHVQAARFDNRFEPYSSRPYTVLVAPSRYLRLLKNKSDRERLAHVDSLQTYRSAERELSDQENERIT